MRLVVNTHDPRETRALARKIGQAAWAGMLLLLDGPLGAGKTHFVQGLAGGLGIAGRVTSPSFTIMALHRGTLPLVHVDLYRLDDPPGEDLGLWENADLSVTAIEWAEKLGPRGEEPCLKVRITPTGEQSRRVVLEAVGSGEEGTRYRELLHRLAAARDLDVEEET